jgi:flagellar biogenesis protein FliO
LSPEATYVLQSLGTVALFGGALWATLWGLRRVGLSGSRGGALEVLARQPLDGRRAIYLVRVGKRVLVIGAGDGPLTRLGSTSLEAIGIDPRKQSEAGAKTSGGFRDALARVLRPATAKAEEPPKGRAEDS